MSLCCTYSHGSFWLSDTSCFLTWVTAATAYSNVSRIMLKYQIVYILCFNGGPWVLCPRQIHVKFLSFLSHFNTTNFRVSFYDGKKSTSPPSLANKWTKGHSIRKTRFLIQKKHSRDQCPRWCCISKPPAALFSALLASNNRPKYHIACYKVNQPIFSPCTTLTVFKNTMLPLTLRRAVCGVVATSRSGDISCQSQTS